MNMPEQLDLAGYVLIKRNSNFSNIKTKFNEPTFRVDTVKLCVNKCTRAVEVPQTHRLTE